MKTISLLITLFFSAIVSPISAASGGDPEAHVEGWARTIHLVDHDSQLLVIDDQAYYMPLNLKVYIKSKYSGVNRLSNRYVLKEGQLVFIDANNSAGKQYVNMLIVDEQ